MDRGFGCSPSVLLWGHLWILVDPTSALHCFYMYNSVPFPPPGVEGMLGSLIKKNHNQHTQGAETSAPVIPKNLNSALFSPYDPPSFVNLKSIHLSYDAVLPIFVVVGKKISLSRKPRGMCFFFKDNRLQCIFFHLRHLSHGKFEIAFLIVMPFKFTIKICFVLRHSPRVS